MTEAEEMLKELGYEKDFEYQDKGTETLMLRYEKKKRVIADMFYEYIAFYNDESVTKYERENNEKLDVGYFTIPEFKATQLRCKELGWLDD